MPAGAFRHGDTAKPAENCGQQLKKNFFGDKKRVFSTGNRRVYVSAVWRREWKNRGFL